MVWIDAQGLNGLGAKLGVLRDGLLPTDVGNSPGSDVFGSADLAAASDGYVTQVRAVRIDGSKEVDSLSGDAFMAAASWSGLDLHLARSMKAI